MIMVNTILEIMYIFCGIVLIVCGIYALNDKGNSKKLGSALFWILFGILFMAGPYLNKALVGAMLLVMGILTATKNVSVGSLINSSEEFRKARAKEIGNKIFYTSNISWSGSFCSSSIYKIRWTCRVRNWGISWTYFNNDCN